MSLAFVVLLGPLAAPSFAGGAVSARQTKEQADYVAGAIRDEVQGVEGELGEDELEGEGGETVIQRLLDRLGRLKGDPKISPAMHKVLERAADAVRSIPSRPYAKKQPGETARAISRQLEFDAERAAGPEDLDRRLRKSLNLPTTLQALPADLPLDKFLQLGPIVIFLVKHRGNAPPSYVDVLEQDVMAARYHVGIGVRMRGVVTKVSDAEDGDYCFDLSSMEMELTPEWHPALSDCRPEPGDLVEVSGWTYYDNFHKDETRSEREFNKDRPTVWEVHPVTGCRILKKAEAR